VTGVGAFGVEVQETIRAEAQRLSIFATAALSLVVLLVYRSLRLLLLSTLPMGMGFLLGLTVVATAFDSVHGIALAFGFTLLGVAIDYPLHLFSHTRRGGGSPAVAMAAIWPTMRLGALSTAVAYLAIALSGSEGLAQLGVFTVTGVVVAALVTRFWLPSLLPDPGLTTMPGGERLSPELAYLPAAALLVLAAATWHVAAPDRLWDDRLSSLSPVPEPRLRTDRALRAAAGTPDMRHQIVMHDDSLESLLAESEIVELRLAEAASEGLLKSWRSVSQLLPSRERQAERQREIPDSDTLRARLDDAVSRTPFHPEAFAPFIAAAETASTLPPLEPAAVAGTLLGPWLDSHLLQLEERWVSLISVREPDAAALGERVAGWGDRIELVDLMQSTATLMQEYRSGVISTVSVAAFAIVLLIWLQRRQLAQILWISLTVAVALATTVVIVSVFHGPLTVIHLVAALLVLGLGLDYALFLSRTEEAVERCATNEAVLACAASTTLAFGILATSSIPVLKFIGFTVAVGSATSYLLALAGSRWPRTIVSWKRR
jgi:predicted exporter